MKLSMTVPKQFHTILPSLLIWGLLLLVFFSTRSRLSIPAFFPALYVFILGIHILCTLIVHINYFLYERNRTYLFTDHGLTVLYKKQVYNYDMDDIRCTRKIHPLLYIGARSFFIVFPSYYYMQIILKNGKVIPISCFIHQDLDTVLKRSLPGKWHEEETRIIPYI